jgi:hypothetical protein
MKSELRIPVLVGTAAALVAVPQLFNFFDRRRRAKKLQKKTRIELLPCESLESSVVFMAPAIASATYFKGNVADVETYFAERVAAILSANPWLTSVLDRDPLTNVPAAYYSSEGTSDPSIYFSVRKDIKVSRTRTSYNDLLDLLAPVLCKPSTKSVGKDVPLWKVALIPDADEPDSRFLLVVSANHSLMDGHGYYRIFNMLSSDTEKIESLSPIRKFDSLHKMDKAFDNEPNVMTGNPGFLFRFITSMMWSAMFPEAVVHMFRMNEEYVNAEKALAKQTKEQNGVEYVSSNDVYLSGILNCTQCDVALQAINFRGRIEGLGDDDIGNYESLLPYYGEMDYRTPAMIRKSLSRGDGLYIRASEPRTKPLTNLQYMKAIIGLATNWSTFARTLKIQGGTQDLHIPLFNRADVPACCMSGCTIFRPDDAGMAVLYIGNQATWDRMKASELVKEEIDMVM